jgi:hypothetical protein
MDNNTDTSNNSLEPNNNPFKSIMDTFSSVFSFAFPIINVNKSGNNQNNIFLNDHKQFTGAVMPINRLGIPEKK